jgi:hypothetical protein
MIEDRNETVDQAQNQLPVSTDPEAPAKWNQNQLKQWDRIKRDLHNGLVKEAQGLGEQADAIEEAFRTGLWQIEFATVEEFAEAHKRARAWVYEMVKLGEQRQRLKRLSNGLDRRRLPVSIRVARALRRIPDEAVVESWTEVTEGHDPDDVTDDMLLKVAENRGVTLFEENGRRGGSAGTSNRHGTGRHGAKEDRNDWLSTMADPAETMGWLGTHHSPRWQGELLVRLMERLFGNANQAMKILLEFGKPGLLHDLTDLVRNMEENGADPETMAEEDPELAAMGSLGE